MNNATSEEKVVSLPVEKIDDPIVELHPNDDLEGLKELADSIKEMGQINPILVRPKGERYQVLAGHRRLKACRTYGIPFLKAIVRPLEDKEAMIACILENAQRIESDPFKEAELFQKLMQEHQMSQAEVAKKFGKSDGYVRTRLKLLGLTPSVKQFFQEGNLNLSVAAEIAKVANERDQQILASDLMERPEKTERAKAIVEGFQKYKEEMQNAPPAEVIERAREIPAVKCPWCRKDVEQTEIMVATFCRGCYDNLKYLTEKDRRENPQRYELPQKNSEQTPSKTE